ncbi:hypothetical protein [Desulfonatronovibrio hydrogenovorans]|uniref:hypothetical protein n=1 Tax=Desulfonatronovibrio hydrogenovorans TaxID=53245 RepID=UPI00048DD763|nr:hypothetical protein [Desulfonatronovibrio hydrogenovorans]
MIPGETIQSMLPQDIPWWMADHFVFFSVLYLVLLTIGLGVGVVVVQSISDTLAEKKKLAQ